MNMNALKVREALLALDHHERAAVINDGIQSLDDDLVERSQDEVDAAWRSELRSRINEIESGEVELLNSSEVFKQHRAEVILLN